jgi:site-specific DNA-cytosine methylase
LSQVLNPTAPARFSLSERAASGILRRANRRGKVLPAALQTALESLAQSPDASAKESIAPLTSHSSSQAKQDKAIGTKMSAPQQPCEDSQEARRVTSSSVRRLTPTECERLMGWPDGWTISTKWTRRG